MLLNKRNFEIVKIAGTDDARYPLGSLYIDTLKTEEVFLGKCRILDDA